MRKTLAFLAAGVAVGLTLARLLGWRRRRVPADAPAAGAPDPRADALRAQLAASRERAEPPAEPSPAGPEVGPGAGAEVDEARRRVHERGRAAVERMRGTQSQS